MNLQTKAWITICIIFLLVFTITITNHYAQDKILEFRDLDIPSNDLKELSSVVGSGDFIICDLNKEDDCSRFKKYPLDD